MLPLPCRPQKRRGNSCSQLQLLMVKSCASRRNRGLRGPRETHRGDCFAQTAFQLLSLIVSESSSSSSSSSHHECRVVPREARHTLQPNTLRKKRLASNLPQGSFKVPRMPWRKSEPCDSVTSKKESRLGMGEGDTTWSNLQPDINDPERVIVYSTSSPKRNMTLTLFCGIDYITTRLVFPVAKYQELEDLHPGQGRVSNIPRLLSCSSSSQRLRSTYHSLGHLSHILRR